jgi:hypothetical protein
MGLKHISYVGLSIENKKADLNTCSTIFRIFSIKKYYHTDLSLSTPLVFIGQLAASPPKHQHNHTHNRAPCLTAPSAHASYKGYECNNVKPLRPTHRNIMINVVVLGCGPIRTGEGAVAPFIGVHILGEIRPAGGG